MGRDSVAGVKSLYNFDDGYITGPAVPGQFPDNYRGLAAAKTACLLTKERRRQCLRYPKGTAVSLHEFMKRFLSFLLFIPYTCIILSLSPVLYAQDAEGDAVLGRWFTDEKKTVVEVYKCGEKYCGKIVWLKNPKNSDGTDTLDINNPDPAKRSRKKMGMRIVWDFNYKGNNRWGDGKIYDPRNGETYSCEINMQGNTMEIRGYVGIPLFGRTMICTREPSLMPASN